MRTGTTTQAHFDVRAYTLAPISSGFILSAVVHYRLANASDASSVGFHPCTEASNQTVPTFFSEDGYTCDDQFMRSFEDPEVLLEAKNGSYVIIVSTSRCDFVRTQ